MQNEAIPPPWKYLYAPKKQPYFPTTALKFRTGLQVLEVEFSPDATTLRPRHLVVFFTGQLQKHDGRH